MQNKKLNKIVGAKLKQARKSKGWSLDATCQHTGVSKAMLGQIERGESSPTIARLWDIANGFDYPLSYFLGDESRTEFHTQPEFNSPDKGLTISTLVDYDPLTAMEIFAISLTPAHEHLSSPHNTDVVEHILVVAGEMEFYLDGQWHVLKVGEAVKFNADQKHGYRNFSHQVATFHNVICYTQGHKK